METMQQVTTVAEMREVTRQFRSGERIVHALRRVNLRLSPGEMIAIQGRSSSGKTTLLNILAGLDNPTSGQVLIGGQDLAPLDEPMRARLRREQIGILFQNAHLFPVLSAQENVEVMLRLTNRGREERRALASNALKLVRLIGRAHHRALELSGGEQQRVALARALVHQPRLLVADEPTGDLDLRTGQEIAMLLREMAHQQHIGILVASHDAQIVANADHVYHLQDGRFVE